MLTMLIPKKVLGTRLGREREREMESKSSRCTAISNTPPYQLYGRVERSVIKHSLVRGQAAIYTQASDAWMVTTRIVYSKLRLCDVTQSFYLNFFNYKFI